MRHVCLVFGLAMLAGVASLSHAQAVGSCEAGQAQGALETTRIKASVFTNGGLFFGGTVTAGDGYQIPKGLASPFGEGASPVFAASFWVGGKVDGELRVASARYGLYNFWPGPLDDAASPPTDCSAYDRIYEVSRQDVARYLATGLVSDNLRDWPVEAGAPVLDGDGDPTNYNLAGGDQPEILGDVAVWWVMNDAGNEHGFRGTLPLGIEVRVLAYAFDPLTPSALGETTFYRYQIANRSAKPIDSLFVSMWTDIDLGGASDDFTGTDTLRNLIYVYNSDNEDDLYGEAPPAWGIQVLDGFVGLANGRDDDFDGTIDEADEEMRLSTAPVAPKNSCTGLGSGDPGTPEGYFNVQKGLFDAGLPIEAYRWGCGPPGTASTVFAYTGDPAQNEYWTEINADGQGTSNENGDRRMVLSTGPGHLAPGESVELVYAMPYARGADHLKSVTALRALAGVLSGAYDQGAFASRPVDAAEYVGNEPLLSKRQLELARVNPNPSASGAAWAVLYLPEEATASAKVYDLLGRELATVVDGVLSKGETVLQVPDGLATGTYLLRVEVAASATETLPFTIVR